MGCAEAIEFMHVYSLQQRMMACARCRTPDTRQNRSSDDSRSRGKPPFKHVFYIRRTRPCVVRGLGSPPSTAQRPN